jgi:hypothetical protein
VTQPNTIWKFPFGITDVVTLHMPRGARILHAGMQGHTACVWALVDSEAPKVERVFRVVGTGNPLCGDGLMEHIASFQEPPFVWHLFECKS